MSNSGYEIIIFGDISHPEIRGVMSYVSGNVYVILNIDDLKNINYLIKLLLFLKQLEISKILQKLQNF